MEERDLDFEITLLPEHWEELGRTAAALSDGAGGFAWSESSPDEIRVFMREEEAPPLWRDYLVGEEGTYGPHEREVARFYFNDGRPFGRIVLPDGVAEPAFRTQETEAMQLELERWVRERWHQLMRDAGVHYEPGHIPQS